MLKKRVITAAFIIIYISLMICIGSWFYRLSVLAFAIMGMYEIYTAFNKADYIPIKSVGYIAILLLFYFLISGQDLGGLLVIILAIMASFIVPLFNHERSPIDAGMTIIGLVYPGLISMCMILLKEYCKECGTYLVILTYLTTWACDTAAYFVGSKFGKNQLSPSISPKKTIEGAIGGLIGSTVVGVILGLIYSGYTHLDIALFHYLVIGLLAGIFAQLGDLVASCIKRFCDLKDFGKILPGHGGILDRFDSILFSVPIIFTYYFLFLV
ncbi:MAG: phosphatidate cytidylyltransferase [Clostridiales bacterium]|nr:phosphatidate cytidylyltransferase [Clostridiales bacterium]